jgi:hypothetical protein
MTEAARKVKAQRQRRPIYLVCENLVRPDTGEAVKGWVAATKWDARAMKERKYHAGTEVRAEFKRRRNVKFHRLAHAIGALVVEQVEDFSGLSAHDALKRLQRECGACCDEITMTLDLGALGKHVVPVKQPRSISFEELDEAEFQDLVAAMYKHLSATYWQSMTPEAVEEMVLMYEQTS